jgi:hypothetical protein
MTVGFVASYFCQLLACTTPTPVPAQVPAQSITVYQVNSSPALTQLTIDQINSIGLNCNQKDYVIQLLENRVGNQAVQPEQLNLEQRKLNAAARSKIWQLRTYC